ncbi:MAG: hypothetical protein ACLQVJ_17040 [Syntrophobacteraceae bacterium]
MAKTVRQKTAKDWEAEGDAHTLARAKEIMADEKRLKAAIAAAKRLADELEEEHKHIKEVGGGELAGRMYPKMEEKKE